MKLVLTSWEDVVEKAKQIRRSGGVHVVTYKPGYIKGTVDGDNGTYQVEIVSVQGDLHTDSWSCTCPWGQWAFKREHTYIGRKCSHALAMYYEQLALDFQNGGGKGSMKIPMKETRRLYLVEDHKRVAKRTANKHFSLEEEYDLIEEAGVASQLEELRLDSSPYELELYDEDL